MACLLACIAAIGSPSPADAADGQSAFNPDISLIFDLRAADLAFGDADREVPGFLLGPETGVGTDGMYLGESELVLSSNIDDRFFGYASIAMHLEDGETEVELEEAFIETLTLPHGLSLKAGRYFSHIGYQNVRHGHTWDFIDPSLPQRVMLANNFGDVGAQLRWVAPTELYMEFGLELFRGDGFPSGGGGDAVAGFAKFGGDVGDSHSWIAGVSYLSAGAEGREVEEHDHDSGPAEPPIAFTGDSDLVILDLTWKWSPHGNWRQRNLVLSTAYYRRDEAGTVDLELDPTPETGVYRGDQTGYYIQATYQFRPRWRLGFRLDGLASDNRVTGLSQGTVLDEDDHSPSRTSLMLDFSNSEYSRIRLQLNRDGSGRDTENQVFLQFIGSLGPHGAHRF
jgi:hypothetical protein